MSVDHGESLVEVSATLFEANEAYSDGNVAAGGALHVRQGQLLLGEGTSLRNNFLTDHLLGSTLKGPSL